MSGLSVSNFCLLVNTCLLKTWVRTKRLRIQNVEDIWWRPGQNVECDKMLTANRPGDKRLRIEKRSRFETDDFMVCELKSIGMSKM